MEPVPTCLPKSILDDGARVSPQFSSLVSTGTSPLQGMEDIHTMFEPAPQTSHSIFQEQVFCSYKVHQINMDTSTTPSSPAAAEMLRGTIDYVQNNQPVMHNPFPDLMSPFQGPMWSPPMRDFPPVVYPIPQNFHHFSPSGPRVWDGLPPIQFGPRAPGDSFMMNMGFKSPSPQFRFSSGPRMLINIPEFWPGAYLPSRQLFFRPEGCPSWCLCPIMEPVYQTCRPELVYRTRDSMVQNGTPTSEDKWPTKAEGEHPRVFTPYKAELQGGHISSEPLVAFQDQVQTHWTWEDNKDVPNSICPKSQDNVCEEIKVEHGSEETPLEELSCDTDSVRNEGSILDTNDLSCPLPSDMDLFDHFTLEDLETLIKENSDSLFDRKQTPPPPAEIERIIQYLLSDAPITEYEQNSNQSEQDLPANEELRKGWRSSSPSQQSLVEEKPADQYDSFSPDHCFEEDMTRKKMTEANGDDKQRRRKRNPEKHSLQRAACNQKTAREKDSLNNTKPKICMVFRSSRGVTGHTDESDGKSHALRTEERKPADKFTPQRNSPSTEKQRKQGSVRRQLFKTEQRNYEEERPNRATQQLEMTVDQESKKFQGKRQKCKESKGKPLDFCRRMEITRKWLSTQEEPREEERGEISKVVKRKTQSKNTEERVQPAERKIKGSKSSSKRDVGVNLYDNPGKALLPQSLMRRGKTRENKHEMTQPVKEVKKPKAKVSGTQFPPAQSIMSKQHPAVDKCNHKALKDRGEPKCPSSRTKKLPSLKTAKRCPESSLFMYPLLSEVPKQQCSVFLEAKTNDRKPKVSQRKGNRIRIKAEPSTEQTKDKEAEQLGFTSKGKKHQQRHNTPKKRKGGAYDTVERLWSSPVKKHRDSEQRGDKLRIKKERGTLRATWHQTE